MYSLPKKARMLSGLSIERAASKLGIPAGYLSQIENGQRQVSSDRAEQISELYGKNKEEIFLPSRYAARVVNCTVSSMTNKDLGH
jgi:transcriptional regulator with XRE-family HTH domain